MKKEKTNFISNKYFIVISLSTLIFCITAGLYYAVPAVFPDFKIIQGIEINSVDFRFGVRNYLDDKVLTSPKSSIYNRIVIAAIDDETISDNGGWPFNRKVWADTLNFLNDSPFRPELTFFDIVFSDPSQNPESDKALKNSFKNFKGTLCEDIILEPIEGLNLNELLSGGEESISTRNKIMIEHALDYNSERVRALRRFEINLNTSNNVTAYPVVSPLLKELPPYLKFVGAANIEARENSSRAIPGIPFILPVVYKIREANGQYLITNVFYPSIVLEIVLNELKAGISDVVAGYHELKIKNAFYNGRKKDFIIPVDENYVMNINYRAGPGSFLIKKVPFKNIVDTELPADSLLFIGMYSKKGSLDLYKSPFGDMYGVEHLGYAIGTILSRDFLFEVPEWVNIIYILFLTLSVGFLTSKGLRNIISAGALSVLFPIILGISFFQFNIIIATFVPGISGILVLLTVQIYMLFTEEKEKSFIKTTFSSYLNPKLVDILIQSPEMIQLGGEDKEVTLLFSTIRNLSDITRGMGAKELIIFLNDYFSRMADIVMETSGTLDKYIGDSVMAFWGAPVDIPEHAFKACEAGLKMVNSVTDFNRERQNKGLVPIVLNIGINTGSIIVGNVGSENQKNYTAVGDSVNLASRLKGLNNYYGTQIVISEYTYQKIMGNVIARELDLARVKGKIKPVRIYELLDFKQ